MKGASLSKGAVGATVEGVQLGRNLDLLQRFVHVHATPGGRGGREAIFFFKTMGGGFLQHPGFGEDVPEVDETDLDDLRAQGLIDIDYTGQGGLKIVPTLLGREIVAGLDAATNEIPVADTGPIVAAIGLQAEAVNKLAWPAVRPVLSALRNYWAEGGFAKDGVALRPILVALPEEVEQLFIATVRVLVGGGYLVEASELGIGDMPAMIGFTDRTFSVLDGWPGASQQDLVENLVAVLSERAEAESDPEKKRRFERTLATVKELGVATAGEVLSKVLLGG